ncbi:hypothetical protein L915_11277 [Phytophthora nicotianae]|uniref:Uncharacterized protein n=1 Tax=Phytophthora nicotianae TaxID=4792 RepID=W2GMI0_PHYNI|nr:hypothetical protein L915_11277 [Phytophthora nicotianae]
MQLRSLNGSPTCEKIDRSACQQSRNRLTIRRITHKGRKKRNDMEAVANVFSRSIQYTIEEKGILSSDMGPEKYASVYNMDQTAVYIDMNGRTTIEFVGAPTVDVLQEVNGFRASVFLVASATGHKLPPFVVFSGVPDARVAAEVWDPKFASSDVEHAVQR